MKSMHWVTLGAGVVLGIVIAPWVRSKLGV